MANSSFVGIKSPISASTEQPNDDIIDTNTGRLSGIQNLIDAKSESRNKTISSYNAIIASSTATLDEKEAELQKNDSESYINLGKVAKAEKVLEEMSELKDELQKAKETCSELQHQTQVLEDEKSTLQGSYDTLQKEVEEDMKRLGFKS